MNHIIPKKTLTPSEPYLPSSPGIMVGSITCALRLNQQNKQINWPLDALQLGATGILFHLNNNPDYNRLLAGIEQQHCAIALSGNVNVDDYLNFCSSQEQSANLVGFVDSSSTSNDNISANFYPTVIHGKSVNELHELQELLDELNILLDANKGEQAELVFNNIAYQLQMSTNYFFGLAKIRGVAYSVK